MAALLSAAEIPPGGEGEIETKIKILGPAGDAIKTVTVETDDPEHERILLKLKGTIVVDAEINPDAPDVGVMTIGEKAKTVVDFVTSRPEEVQATKVEIASDIDNVWGTILPGKNGQRIQIEVQPSKIGVFKRPIKILTTSKGQPFIEAEVSANVLGIWEATPHYIAFLPPQEGEEMSETIVVKSRRRTQYKVLSAVDPSGAVETKLKRVAGGFSVEAIMKRYKKGVRGTIDITTNDPDESQIKVEYYVRRWRPRKGAKRPGKRGKRPDRASSKRR